MHCSSVARRLLVLLESVVQILLSFLFLSCQKVLCLWFVLRALTKQLCIPLLHCAIDPLFKICIMIIYNFCCIHDNLSFYVEYVIKNIRNIKDRTKWKSIMANAYMHIIWWPNKWTRQCNNGRNVMKQILA